MAAEPFLGEIQMVGFAFAPPGWAMCDGQFLSISQNTALFSLLGTTYGGNGQTTFALPDLRGRFPIHSGGGNGPGLSTREMGETGGQEFVTLSTNQMPQHTHGLPAAGEQTSDRPGGLVPAKGGNYGPANSGPSMAPSQVSGGNQPHENMPPYLSLNFIIALEGIYPSRG
ncbi:phage tail protein [Paeniglutamicibacter sp. R2-26]|uniref:phage tail protein n=1 Tax=Paeniglutamicibacter sp. R2-26 TaxID=3144417 RepID=UPI003EE7B6A6